jgi:hypothetical protein
MAFDDAPGEEVEAQPAALVLVVGLVGELGGREALAEILGHDQLGGRVDRPDRLHRAGDSKALDDGRPKHRVDVVLVWIPMAVKA